MISENIKIQLFALQDCNYKSFTEKLIPSVHADRIIGVRLPAIQKLAANLSKMDDIDTFLKDLPHTFVEENHLHGFILSRKCRSFDAALDAAETFLPYIDNWAVCDSFRIKALTGSLDALYPHVQNWLHSAAPYTVRYALVLMLKFYLTDRFEPKMLEEAARIRSDNYYVRMAVAWYFSTALIKQFDAVLPLFQSRALPKLIHHISIQKAVDSKQLDNSRKDQIKALRY